LKSLPFNSNNFLSLFPFIRDDPVNSKKKLQIEVADIYPAGVTASE
jgi:hypothetical protein